MAKSTTSRGWLSQNFKGRRLPGYLQGNLKFTQKPKGTRVRSRPTAAPEVGVGRENKSGTQLLPQEWHGCAGHKIELATKPLLHQPSVKAATLAKHNKLATHQHTFTKTSDTMKELQHVGWKQQLSM